MKCGILCLWKQMENAVHLRGILKRYKLLRTDAVWWQSALVLSAQRTDAVWWQSALVLSCRSVVTVCPGLVLSQCGDSLPWSCQCRELSQCGDSLPWSCQRRELSQCGDSLPWSCQHWCLVSCACPERMFWWIQNNNLDATGSVDFVSIYTAELYAILLALNELSK